MAKGLGERDEGVTGDSAMDFIRRMKSRASQVEAERQRAAALARSFDAPEEEAAQGYEEEDLRGMRVAHDLDAFEEQEEHILTLEDQRIGEEDEGQEMSHRLIDTTLAERERWAKAREAKRGGGKRYTGYDDTEFTTVNPSGPLEGRKPRVLPQYDEVIDGADAKSRDKGFLLGHRSSKAQDGLDTGKDGLSRGQGEAWAYPSAEQEGSLGQSKRVVTSLEVDLGREAQDFLTTEETMIQFPKKKNRSKGKGKKSSRKHLRSKINDHSEEKEGEAMNDPIESEAFAPTEQFVDDDDLQEALARVRMASLTSKKKRDKKTGMKGMDEVKKENDPSLSIEKDDGARAILEQIQQRHLETSATPSKELGDEGLAMDMNQEAEGDPLGSDMVLSNSSEFVRRLAQRQLDRQQELETKSARYRASSLMSEEGEGGVMDGGGMVIPTTQPEWGKEEGEGDEEMEAPKSPRPNQKMMEEVKVIEEPLVSGGMAETLKLMRQQGVIQERSEEEINRDKRLRERMQFLANAKRREFQAEREREKRRRAPGEVDGGGPQSKRARGSRGAGDEEGKWEEDYEDEQREAVEQARREAQSLREELWRMENFKPEVNLRYTDELGHELTAKEAFRYQSHQFHGVESGRRKKEKRMAQLMERQAADAQGLNTTPRISTVNDRRRKGAAAHIQLL